jgi:predicted enzyme related to lactoylglutathione lyase
MDFLLGADLNEGPAMPGSSPTPLVHLELHTANLGRAGAFYTRVCGWRAERITTAGRSYQALDWEGEVGGGIVECGTSRPLWLPYVEVAEIEAATELAVAAGAHVMFDPREGPSGWRSVVTVPDGAELAFWQPKRSG